MEVWLHSFLALALDGASRPDPFTPSLRKNDRLNRRLGVPQDGLEILEKTVFPVPRFELRILQPAAQLANIAGMGTV
jgi:hypothetical protein